MRDHTHEVTEEGRAPGRAPVSGHRHALLALQAVAGNGNVSQMLRETGHPWAQGAGGSTVQRSPGEVKAPDLGLKPGEEAHSELGADSRMLNRMARYMMGSPRGEQGLSARRAGTPHLALTAIGGQVHVAGNSGMSEEDRAKALGRLDADGLRKKAAEGDHDAKKLVKLIDGKTPETTSGSLGAIRGAAMQPGGMTWHNSHAPSRGVVHGEMALLDEVAKAMQSSPQPEPGGLQDWPISGRKRDCLACHWAHAIFNTHIANPLGYRIVSSGTHGGVFPNWKMPGWMVDNSAAAGAMKAKLAEHDLVFGKGNTIKTEVKKGTKHELNPPGSRSDEPYFSDSSVEDEPISKEEQAAPAESQAAPAESQMVSAEGELASAAGQLTLAETEPVPATAEGSAAAPAEGRRGGNRGRGGHRGRGGGRGRGRGGSHGRGGGRGRGRGRGGHRGRGHHVTEEES